MRRQSYHSMCVGLQLHSFIYYFTNGRAVAIRYCSTVDERERTIKSSGRYLYRG